VEDNKTS